VKVFGVSVCTYHIGEQTPQGLATYANVGAAEINVAPVLTEIIGTRQGAAECGAAASITGGYSGQTRIMGEETGTGLATNVQVG
jgi:hypothetical protein